MARRPVARGIVTAVDDTGEVQTVQVQTGADSTDNAPDLEVFQPAGLSHVPNAAADRHGAEAIVVETSPGLDVATSITDRRRRPTGKTAGDTVLYGTHSATAADNARVECLSNAVAVKGRKLTVEDGAEVGGSVDADGGYKTDGTAGVTGTLKITLAGSGVNPGVATVQIKGGIVTSVVATGNCEWTGV